MSILIKNGHIVTASEDFIADIYIEGEKIKAIGKNLSYDVATTIDATDKLIFPGGIDPHVHLDMPFMGTYSSDNYETGTLAALFGGTTTVIDFILQTQGDTLHNALKTWKKKAKGNAIGDYSYHMAVTDFNNDVAKEVVQFIEEEGITSFKTFMAYKGALMIDDGQMVQLMKVVKKHGGIVTVHATNGDMIDSLVSKNREAGNLSPLYHYLSQPEVTEAEASARFLDMLHYTGCRGYIVHMTCEGALNAVRKATLRNQKAYVETCTQYLVLDASLYEKGFEAAKWVMSPPLREKKDQNALWSGINQGLIQTVGTDHCPFLWEQKEMGKDDFSKIPNGHPAIEHRMELLYSEGVRTGKISLSKFVEVSATNAAKIFGMYPQKGTLAIGSDADIIIFDPNKQHTISATTHHMNCDYSGYEGKEIIGKTETVLLRGKIAIADDSCLLTSGDGKFVKRKAVTENI
ncbi:dihydropyrimidinase [Cellulophaga baltica]|uniref:dihydropyrimidinase n=1 Tax=Cellulophaga TaxID=104264 RepID=UPI001C070C67|nr:MULTISPECIES: dihydropyrimidinase [Cellulophaga]MBU2996670.1 dihydropyrimidinase [Cellulophaga baltica]MDO6768064.1 dihydropyrimidinase [Cellulophaga sp. 1_MG-2023]